MSLTSGRPSHTGRCAFTANAKCQERKAFSLTSVWVGLLLNTTPQVSCQYCYMQVYTHVRTFIHTHKYCL